MPAWFADSREVHACGGGMAASANKVLGDEIIFQHILTILARVRSVMNINIIFRG